MKSGTRMTFPRAMQLRQDAAEGATRPQLAVEYGITEGQVSRILRNQSWRIDEPLPDDHRIMQSGVQILDTPSAPPEELPSNALDEMKAIAQEMESRKKALENLSEIAEQELEQEFKKGIAYEGKDGRAVKTARPQSNIADAPALTRTEILELDPENPVVARADLLEPSEQSILLRAAGIVFAHLPKNSWRTAQAGRLISNVCDSLQGADKTQA